MKKQKATIKAEIIRYTPQLTIRNAASLTPGLGRRYLSCIRSHTGELVAKNWHCTIPAMAEVIVVFGGEATDPLHRAVWCSQATENKPIRLGNVDFWIDNDAAWNGWNGQLSYSLPVAQWDKEAIARDLTALTGQRIPSKATPWPNGLGWDVDDSEVFKHDYKDSRFMRVFTPDRTALVASTDDPVKAVILTREHGFLRAELMDMDHRDAQKLFESVVL